MFTGIVTDIGTVLAVRREGDLRIEIGTSFDAIALDLGASVACSGVCLTVVERAQGMFAVDVSAETVSLTAADHWRQGARLNLERSLRVGDELGGHIVLGHVDGVGRVEAVRPDGGSVRITVAAPPALAPFLATKGSVAVDGVSLTVNGVEDADDGPRFTLNIIPHTAEATTLRALAVGDEVNLEADPMARYLQRMVAVREGGRSPL